jgi:diguanylate cyclase (GGDEF)-like protein/PAS domain S-box-containing protein
MSPAPPRNPGNLVGRAWMAYLGAGALLCLLYVAVPPFHGSGPVMNLLGLSPVIAILAGIRLHRPASPGPWQWFAAGFALFWFGDLYTYSYPLLLNGDVPFPSFGDGAYLLVYPALIAGLVMLVRRRRSRADSGRLIDGLILTVGLALPSWVALIAPYVHDDTLTIVAKAVSVAYPLADVLLLAAAIPLALDAGRREPAFYLVSSSIVLLLVTDFVYGVLTLHGAYNHQLWLDLGWLGFYLLWGAAALHPSMARIEQAGQRRETLLTRFRLALLTCASLVAPAFEFVHDLQRRDYDMAVVTAASAILFGLVVLRMAGLVRQHERSLDRERILGSAGADLVGATGRTAIEEVAVGSARALAGPGSAAVVVARGLIPAVAADDEGAATVQLDAATRARVGLPADHERALVLSMTPRRGAPAALVVAGPGVAGDSVQEALRALATQISLALDSAALSEEVHRRRSEARFGSLVQHSSDLITVLGPDARVSYQSPSIERVLGYAPEEIVGTPFGGLIDAADRSRLLHLVEGMVTGAGDPPQAIECTLVHKDGGTCQFEILMTNLLQEEHVGGIVLNARDVSERKAFEAQLTHQAFHDAVTGLANRALFAERVRHAITRSRREDRRCAVLFLDLDDFKEINDSLGHAAGDEVLIEVARRLDSSVRGADTAARFGGDEFAVLLEDIKHSQEAADTAERVLEALSVPLRAGHKELALRCSLGISVLGADSAATADEMIRDADAAMYIAKRDGKGGYRLFEPEMHEGVLERLELRTDLQRAITNGQLELYYQPVVRLEDGGVAGLEALLRWNHPERGMVPPDQFIPIAEETGLIVPIGRWVLREGCRHAKRVLETMPGESPSISINLSLKQIHQSDIVSDVRDALIESGLEPGRLTLEITETVLMADTEHAVQRLRELKALGVRLALDDFGTGYSSLSYLSKFPVDILKMDRSFLRAGASPEAADLANAVVALGATLDLEVVAEGIELPEQWHNLRDLGCDLGQGYYFAKPMNADATLAFLADAAKRPVDAA